MERKGGPQFQLSSQPITELLCHPFKGAILTSGTEMGYLHQALLRLKN